MGYIYLRTNTVNGKKYVGLTTDLKTRQYNWNNLNQPYAGAAINAAREKYGIDAFDFEILKECKDEELDYWEMYYIKELNTKAPYGYNLTDGGEGVKGCNVSEETKKKLSERMKGENNPFWGKHHTEETKEFLKMINVGKKWTEEQKKKMSETRKGRKMPPRSEEWKMKQMESQKGRKHTEETRKKMSEKRKGENNGMYGKHHTEEARKKMSEKRINRKDQSKPVLQINIYTDEIIAEFCSVAEAQRQLGIPSSNISQCCTNYPGHKSAGGFKWQYKSVA